MNKGVARLCGLIVWVAVGSAAAQEGGGAAAPVDGDAALESQIELRFTEDERLFGRGLDARVKAGTAVLTGTVKTSADWEHAESLARAAGAPRVDNQLVIEPPPPVAKSKLANEPMTNEERERRRRARDEAAMKEAALTQTPVQTASTAQTPSPAQTPAQTPAPPSTAQTPAPPPSPMLQAVPSAAPPATGPGSTLPVLPQTPAATR